MNRWLVVLVSWLVVLTGCASCPDTSIKLETLDADQLKVQYYGASFSVTFFHGSVYFVRHIGVGMTSKDSLHVNLLPSFSSNGFSVYVDGSKLPYNPGQPTDAGGVHTIYGDCGEVYYPNQVSYSDQTSMDSLDISVRKGGNPLVSWQIPSPVDTSLLPLVRDSIVSDTILTLSIHNRDTAGRYRFEIRDGSGNSLVVQDSVRFKGDLHYSIPLGKINFLSSNYRKWDASNLFVFVYSKAQYGPTYQLPSDSLRINSFDLDQEVSDSSLAKIRRYLK